MGLCEILFFKGSVYFWHKKKFFLNSVCASFTTTKDVATVLLTGQACICCYISFFSRLSGHHSGNKCQGCYLQEEDWMDWVRPHPFLPHSRMELKQRPHLLATQKYLQILVTQMGLFQLMRFACFFCLEIESLRFFFSVLLCTVLLWEGLGLGKLCRLCTAPFFLISSSLISHLFLFPSQLLYFQSLMYMLMCFGELI